MASYIPSTDAGFDGWFNNFQTVIAASPATYGVAAGDATALTTSFNAWHAAYLLAFNVGTRTSATIAAKDTQKASSLITARTYAQLIQSNTGVSNGAKSAAGLTVRATGRTPVPAPGTSPILGLVGSTPGEATLKFADTSTPTTKAKPLGAIQMEVYAQVNPTGTPDVALSVFQGLQTKSPFALDTPAGGLGKTVVLWARWVTRRGLTGPWSAPLSVIGT